MTSLQHHSHLLNHHNTPNGNNSASNSLNMSLNNSSNNLSPVIQRKIETQLSNNSVNNKDFNRYSSGSGGTALTNQGPDFDTTSIASVSESSHWSGGGGDDLDNIALVNGSDCINTMENKDWSTYLKMAKNGYNSSDDDNTNNNGNSNSDGNNDDSKDENDEDLSLCDENINSNRYTGKNKYNVKKESNNQLSSNVIKNNSNLKISSRSSINSRKNSDKINSSSAEFSKNPKKLQQDFNKKSSKDVYILEQATKKISNSNSESANKKLKKKISQDSFESHNAYENENKDAFKPNKTNSLSDEELDRSNTANENESKQKQKISIDNENENNEEIEIEESEEELDDVDDDDYDDDEVEDDDEDEEDDLDDDDIWTIKPKLYSYYEKQFKTMEPNLNGFITGSVAKPFFERSKLPLNELSKIWELSDVTKDGVLSFAEFCTAMHLVVLRVRNFDLPNELPEKLQPYAPLIDFNTDATNNPIRKENEGSMLIISDSEEMLCSPAHQISRLVHGPAGESLVQFSLKPQIPNDVEIAHPVALRYNTTNQYQNTIQTGSMPEPPPRQSRSSSLGTIKDSVANANNNQQHQHVVPPHLTVPSTVGSVNISNNLNTPKILQQQPVVPPRITSPPPVYHHQQTQGENFQQSQPATSGALLPPPPPPLSHHQLHHHQNRLYHHQQHYPINQQSSLSFQSNTRIPPPPPNNEEIAKHIERLIEQMTKLNVERLKKINESNQKQQAIVSSSTPSTNSIDVDGLIRSIKTQTVQNQLLRRMFNELEKELRALTDNRIALEIKLDYLNTTQSAQPTPNINPAILNPNVNVTSTNTSGNGIKHPVPVTPIVASGNQLTNPSSNLSSSNTNPNTNAAITPSANGSIINQTPTTKTNILIHSKNNI